MKKNILGIIPARGGSKGVPGKNIKLIAEKPLIVWTIETAKMSKLLDRFVVSTEDARIAEISRRHGAEVIIRPEALATDKAKGISVIQHVLSIINADIVVLLQPTSPVRNPCLIDRCIRKFKKTKVDNLATGFICKFMDYGSYTKRRQDLKGFFYDDGSVYVIKADLIKKGNMFGKKVGRVITSREENIDIDDEFDFWLAEQVLYKRIRENRC